MKQWSLSELPIEDFIIVMALAGVVQRVRDSENPWFISFVTSVSEPYLNHYKWKNSSQCNHWQMRQLSQLLFDCPVNTPSNSFDTNENSLHHLQSSISHSLPLLFSYPLSTSPTTPSRMISLSVWYQNGITTHPLLSYQRFPQPHLSNHDSVHSLPLNNLMRPNAPLPPCTSLRTATEFPHLFGRSPYSPPSELPFIKLHISFQMEAV